MGAECVTSLSHVTIGRTFSGVEYDLFVDFPDRRSLCNPSFCFQAAEVRPNGSLMAAVGGGGSNGRYSGGFLSYTLFSNAWAVGK